MQVGPESAGAHPGPVCYRKGGYAAITDANLVLGRILPEFFPNIFGPNEDQPLDSDAARRALEELARQINEGSPGQPAKSVDEVKSSGCLHELFVSTKTPWVIWDLPSSHASLGGLQFHCTSTACAR